MVVDTGSDAWINGAGFAPTKERRRFTPRRGVLVVLISARGSVSVGPAGSHNVTQIASSASQMVRSLPRTWKRASSANWPTFSMNIRALLDEGTAGVLASIAPAIRPGPNQAAVKNKAKSSPLKTENRRGMMLLLHR